MKKYLYISKASFIQILGYRSNVILSSIFNLVYIIVIYFLWKAIYSETGPVINGMSFQQTFLYLSLASTIFNSFRTGIDWEMGTKVISGDILMDIAKPLDINLKFFFSSIAYVAFNIFWIGLPVIVIGIVFLSKDIFIIGGGVYSIIALLLAYLITFQIDYLAGLVSFYTESIWGVSSTKESIVLLFSGAIVPIAFFPDALQIVMAYLPFQYIYHAPLSMLVSNDLGTSFYYETISIQLAWVGFFLVLSKLCQSVALKQITVNGG